VIRKGTTKAMMRDRKEKRGEGKRREQSGIKEEEELEMESSVEELRQEKKQGTVRESTLEALEIGERAAGPTQFLS
jgi:hypothetical protein